MIFFLAPTISHAISAAPPPDLVNAMQHLADSRRCGLNEILGDREVLRAVSNCQHLSSSARAIYGRLSEVSTRMHQLLAECELYVLVSDQPAICARETIAGQERIVLSVEHLARHQRLSQSAVLLCENLDDCTFLNWIGQFYADWRRLPNRLQFEARNGGGHTTAQVYDAILESRDTQCLCISDSDLKYEGDTALGETARAIQEVHARRDTTLAHLHVLQCQEAENMIPASILADVYASDANKLAASADLQAIQGNAAHELWRYYDVKKGLCTFELLHPSNPEFQSSWCRAFGSVVDITSATCSGCREHEQCEHKSDCTVYLGRGLGMSVLSDTIESFFSMKSPAEVRRRVPPRMAADWSAVGRLVWTWGTAGYRMAAC
jgi:hypothetical protein